MNNERIKELEKQCYVFVEGDRVDSDTETFEDHVIFDKEKFAELIIAECRASMEAVWYSQGLDLKGAEIQKFLLAFDEQLGVE
jgi:hypothetical protein